jgi:hypothetical protein
MRTASSASSWGAWRSTWKQSAAAAASCSLLAAPPTTPRWQHGALSPPLKLHPFCQAAGPPASHAVQGHTPPALALCGARLPCALCSLSMRMAASFPLPGCAPPGCATCYFMLQPVLDTSKSTPFPPCRPSTPAIPAQALPCTLCPLSLVHPGPALVPPPVHPPQADRGGAGVPPRLLRARLRPAGPALPHLPRRHLRLCVPGVCVFCAVGGTCGVVMFPKRYSGGWKLRGTEGGAAAIGM